MQVNSGKNKGTRLFSSDDEAVRPTTDKVKQAIFNLISFDVKKGKVLDLFAGSGALGIEALSRGFEFCDFSDINPVWVNKNIEKCKLFDCCNIHKGDFEAFLNKTKNTYSLVFLDPPYHKDFIQKALFIMVKNNLLDKDAIIVMESDFDEEYIIPDEIKVIKEKCYGRIKIRIGVRL